MAVESIAYLVLFSFFCFQGVDKCRFFVRKVTEYIFSYFIVIFDISVTLYSVVTATTRALSGVQEKQILVSISVFRLET